MTRTTRNGAGRFSFFNFSTAEGNGRVTPRRSLNHRGTETRRWTTKDRYDTKLKTAECAENAKNAKRSFDHGWIFTDQGTREVIFQALKGQPNDAEFWRD